MLLQRGVIAGMADGQTPSALASYRVLDLTDEKGQLCGKILADLGADVIKIEKPGSDAGYDPRLRSFLTRLALNTSKRSVALDIESREGRDTFAKLAATADVVVESWQPGYLDGLGLGYQALAATNPGIILVSVTGFGQTGPYRDFKTSDLVAGAMGGLVYIMGDEDRRPVRVTAPQSYMHAGLHAAAGALLALHYRERTGEGQHVDVSVQEAVARVLALETLSWGYAGNLFRRMGPRRGSDVDSFQEVFPCKDGQVAFRLIGATRASNIKPLVQWMEGMGKAGILTRYDWNSLDIPSMKNSEVREIEGAFLAFFREHTKAELHREALRRKFALALCATPEEIVHDTHLKARGFWMEVDQPGLERTIAFPGAPYILSRTPWKVSRRPPLVGEHSREILEDLDSRLTRNRDRKPDSGGALEGVRIMEITHAAAGPMLGKYLADFGATVVKLESRSHPDIMRVSAPYLGNTPDLDRGGNFFYHNTSKCSLGINLNDSRCRGVLDRVVGWADVLIENMMPGTLEKWGLGQADLYRSRPDMIVMRCSAYGQTGPHSRLPGFGWNMSGMAGIPHMTGWPDRDCVAPSHAYTDFLVPGFAVSAIVAALVYRKQTGEGQIIDMSQLEAALTFISPALMDYSVNGRNQNREGNRSEEACPHNVYRCVGDDRWCAIAVESDEEWRGLCRALGDPPWCSDSRFASFELRKSDEENLDRLIGEWTLEREAEDVMRLMQANGVPAGVARSAREIVDSDPQLKHRGFFQWLEQPGVGRALVPAWPVKMSRSPARVRPAPRICEHTEYVLTELVGLSDEDFMHLLSEGVVE